MYTNLLSKLLPTLHLLNAFRLFFDTFYIGKSHKPRPSVMGLSGLSDSVAVPGVRRRSNCIFSENELTARFSEFRSSTLQAHGKPTLTSEKKKTKTLMLIL